MIRAMQRLNLIPAGFLILALFPGSASAQWVQFEDQTAVRLVADPTVGADDPEEKDYAWGDVDLDGDIDLVVVRKTIGTSFGKRTNVLLMNENGILVDRTAQYAVASDVPGDQGFLTPTNDRDVQLVDINQDNRLDIITSVTLSDSDPQHIGYPRIYLNLGNDGGGSWLGFRYESARIPAMVSDLGNPGHNPRFCSLAVGDLNGDGDPDLFFSDYDAGAQDGTTQDPAADFNDKLLINNGLGFFSDQTEVRFLGAIDIPGEIPQSFPVSSFGASAVIADMNGDGTNDIVKQTALFTPLYVGIAYNDPADEGFFDDYEVVNQQAPYFVSVADLNNDGMLDMVVSDDGLDRYMLNQGNGPDGRADFLDLTFEFDAAIDDGFGSNSLILDLNQDGWNDVIVTGNDIDNPNCGFRTHIYQNQGGAPGSDVILRELTSGPGCQGTGAAPTCTVAGIPANQLLGVHDVAVFDINQDGLLDMVSGSCFGTQVFMGQPPTRLDFSFPQGFPEFVELGSATPFQVQISDFGAAVPLVGTGRLFVSVAGGPFNSVPMTHLGDNLYDATLPAATGCGDRVEFYFTSKAIGAGVISDPPDAPATLHVSRAGHGTMTRFAETVEGDVSAWTIQNDPSLIAGSWEQADPVGTSGGAGQPAAPNEDAQESPFYFRAFVTENGLPGGSAGDADVDGGPTDLITPAIDLQGVDARISYDRWFTTDGDDSLTVWITDDGQNWQLVETVDTTGGTWQEHGFWAADYITPGPAVQLRFRTADNPNDSITEAGIDDLRVEGLLCTPCVTDIDCSDGIYCNGPEVCSAGLCSFGITPCPSSGCDETADTCLECLFDSECDDFAYCSGVESCVNNVCVAGADPCPGQACNDGLALCVECTTDVECSDGVFCNGVELCNAPGFCGPGTLACPAICDETADTCVGNVELQPLAGQPLPGLSPQELTRFDLGRQAFNSAFDAASGLGPVFNQISCGNCHNNPTGGPGSILVTRFGFNDDKGGGFDALAGLGGSLRQEDAISPVCVENVPPEANIVAQRLTTSTLGLGLIESIPDPDLESRELNPPGTVTGRVHWVEALENPGTPRAGRMGWKSQVATALTFSADAALNEIGITNRLVPEENAPNGDLGLLASCDTVQDPEDGPDGQGFDFIDRVTDFQRFLAAPPQTPRSGMLGELYFSITGCADCHTPSLTTSDDAALEPALRSKSIRPYSDFLLHDMGAAADFIEQGDAGATEIRTTPLWGLRTRDPLWHDGRIAGGTLENRLLAAIAEHDALGSEASVSAQNFAGLPQFLKDALIAFLDSLGRAEFDHDGDGDRDQADYLALLNCFSGPGFFYGPDDACAIFDVDLDGDVDADDQALFVVAADGQAGSVPDGSGIGQSPLSVERSGAFEVVLNWDPSCAEEDLDYAVYEGSIGEFAELAPRLCSTAGTTSATFIPAFDDAFFLVVPSNGFREGSYGLDGSGSERPASDGSCLPQSIANCP